jgi:hypothetical protein
LQREVCPIELSEDRVRDALLRRCRSERVEPPGASRIERVLGSARAGHDAQFTARTLSRLSDGATLRRARLVGDAPDAPDAAIVVGGPRVPGGTEGRSRPRRATHTA